MLIKNINKCRQYQYVEINGCNFCLQQNTALFAWMLYVKRDELISILKGWLNDKQYRTGRYLPHYSRLILSNFKTLIIFILYQLGLRKSESVLKLPVYGEFCMPVHKGYKIFNLHSRVVAKVFDSDIDKPSISSEIELLKKVSHINFAPALGKWNIDERWYEEDYIDGSMDTSHKSVDSATLLKSFHNEIVPCINSLMSFQDPVTRKSIEYVNEIIGIIEVGMSAGHGLEGKEVDKTRNFVHSVMDRLKSEGNLSVHLVFTHGDLCPANIMNTGGGIRLLDWESAAYRSMFFDFYSYFFFRPVCLNISTNILASEINEALPQLISELALRTPGIADDSLNSGKVYRWLYYIEFICKLAERSITDNNLNIGDFISKYIEAFNSYEEIMN